MGRSHRNGGPAAIWNLWRSIVGGKDIEPRRVKRAEIGLRLLKDTFTTGYRPQHYEIVDGLPKGARIIGAEVDSSREVIVLYVEHESFPEIPHGGDALDTLQISASVATFEDCRWGETYIEELAEAVK